MKENKDMVRTEQARLGSQEATPAVYPDHGEPCNGPPPWCSPAFVVLSRIEGQNGYSGVTELSFAMARAVDRVNIFVSQRDARSSFLNTIVGADIKFQVDGRRNAEVNAERLKQANETLEVWDVADPNLPISIDWTAWWSDNAPYEKTMSGVRDKFKARNAPYVMKGDPDGPTAQDETVAVDREPKATEGMAP